MPSVVARIAAWASEIPTWERQALDWLLQGRSFGDTEYGTLLTLLLQEDNLHTGPSMEPEYRVLAGAFTMPEEARQPFRLRAIRNLRNVNALVEDQELTFCDGLTVVYGANGSGKSGFARVLGCAGFTRGDQAVLPNVTVPESKLIPQSAEIEVEDGEGRRTIEYYPSTRQRELSGFYVFDSTSVAVHLTEANKFSFTPAGLKTLTRLSQVVDEVKRRLDRMVVQSRRPNPFLPLFEGKSDVRTLVAALNGATDLEHLERLSALTDEDVAREAAAAEQLQAFRSLNLDGQLESTRRSHQDLKELQSTVTQLARRLGPTADDRVKRLQTDQAAAMQAAAELGVARFQNEQLNGVGSPKWRQLISAAAAFGADQTGPQVYPQPGDVCLLCQQPLSAAAQDLLKRAWRFLEHDSQAALEAARSAIRQETQRLTALPVEFFAPNTVAYRILETLDRPVASKVSAFAQWCRQRRDALVAQLTDGGLPTLGGTPAAWPNPAAAIDGPLNVLQDRLTSLGRKRQEDPSERLTAIITRYRHRRVLAGQMSAIEDFVKSHRWADRAASIVVSTRHVTTKYHDLFKELVTEKYVELFGETLKKLKRTVAVSVETAGRKGAAVKQLQLAFASAGGETTPLATVLSEGEKRAVALADFLTEVALDTQSSGVILDDPVTSLDLDWRASVANILAEVAETRQVIVLTHDLPFVYYLRAATKSLAEGVAFHWIMRGTEDDRPGYVYLDNCPALEKEFCKPTRARDFHAKAAKAGGSVQESYLSQGFAALRTSYEAFIVFDLLNEVVGRFEERISVGRLRQIVWDPSIRDQAVEKHEYLSRFIEGHLHSDAFAATKPTTQMLLAEIQAFEELRKRLKQLR